MKDPDDPRSERSETRMIDQLAERLQRPVTRLEWETAVEGGRMAKAELDARLEKLENAIVRLSDRIAKTETTAANVHVVEHLAGKFDSLETEMSRRLEALEERMTNVGQHIFRLQNQEQEPATKKPATWRSNRPKCSCPHPDADFITSVGRRICSYCGDEAQLSGPRDLKTRQSLRHG